MSLIDLADDEILREAAAIISRRDCQRQERLQVLFNRYARKRSIEPHSIGRPKPLTQEESLLLFALERNKFEVEADSNTKWNGSATCKYHVREGAICIGAESRTDLLRGLWSTVSGEERLTEEHLQGSIVQRDIRELNRILREQEKDCAEEA